MRNLSAASISGGAFSKSSFGFCAGHTTAHARTLRIASFIMSLFYQALNRPMEQTRPLGTKTAYLPIKQKSVAIQQSPKEILGTLRPSGTACEVRLRRVHFAPFG